MLKPMRPVVFFFAFVGLILGTIAWILGGTRDFRQLSLPLDYDDEGL